MKKKFLGIISLLTVTLSINFSQQIYANSFATYYNEAQEHLKQNRYTSSIIAFRKALKINYLDNSARIGIINAYLARASYYAEQEKNFDKAANDFRSALFYLKIYPTEEQLVQNSAGMISSVTENLNQCIKVVGLDTTPSSRYKLGEELKTISNLTAAAYEFSKAAQSEKYFNSANIQIADLLKALGNEARALDYYKMVVEKQNVSIETRMKYARTLDRLGLFDEAATQYNIVLADSKGDQEILFALERIYMSKLAMSPSDAEMLANVGAIKQALGDFESALNYYSKAEQINPNNVNTRLNAGTLFQQKKEFDKALKAYNSVLMHTPENTQALLYKAQCEKEMGDNKTAISTYKKLLSIDPSNNIAKNEMSSILKSTMSNEEYLAYMIQNATVDNLYDYAYELHKNNDLKSAINAYQAVITKMPTKIDAYVNLGICYATQENYPKAIEILNSAKTKFPTNNTILKTLQNVQNDYISVRLTQANKNYENKDYQNAIKEYLSINPQTEDSLLGIASSYQALKDYNSAIEYYKKAEKINPNNAEIPYYIGYLYSEQQNWQMAETYLTKAIQKNPKSEAKNLLTYVQETGSIKILNEGIDLFEKNDFGLAIIKFNTVINKNINNPYAYYYRGMIYDEQKQYKSAINDYLKVLNLSKEFPIANYLTAIDYDNLGNYKEAYKYFGQFITVYSANDEYLQYAKSRMEELKPYVN